MGSVKGRFSAAFLSLTLTGALLFSQQQPPAPRSQAELNFSDNKRIVVNYGRPFRHGRSIFGGLVPYGKVWGAGAGPATSLTTEVFLQIDEVTVPPGKYSLYALPSREDWILILSQKTGQPSTAYPEGYDFARFKMKKRELSETADQLTITLEPHGSKRGAMRLKWEKTEVWIDFAEKEPYEVKEDDAS